jgi:acetylglutamate kinase
MSENPSPPIVIKIGGSTLGAHDTSIADCAALHQAGRAVVIVHGGGATVSDWLGRLAVPTEFVSGLRKTTAESREVVVAVLAGLINKQLVQQFAALGVRAVGLCGADGGILRSVVNSRGLGFVGDAPVCDASALQTQLDAGLLPVVSPIGLTPSGDELLNINADTAAGAIAAALRAEQLIFLTDVPGILDHEKNLVPCLDAAATNRLQEDGTLAGGMLPKVEACLVATNAGTRTRIVDGRAAGAIDAALTGKIGTTVV